MRMTATEDRYFALVKGPDPPRNGDIQGLLSPKSGIKIGRIPPPFALDVEPLESS